MYALSKFSFISNYNKDKFTKQEASEKGLSSNLISQCDTDGDGQLTVDEILSNQDACDKILAQINAEAAKVVNSIKSLKAEKIETENDEKNEVANENNPNAAEQADNNKAPKGPFGNFMKDAFKFGNNSNFSIAA
jgi:hypothetical protein